MMLQPDLNEALFLFSQKKKKSGTLRQSQDKFRAEKAVQKKYLRLFRQRIFCASEPQIVNGEIGFYTGTESEPHESCIIINIVC